MSEEQDYTWYGEPWRRAAATLMDCAILALPYAVLMLIFSQQESGEALIATGIVLASGMFMFYRMILEGSALQGTPGKRLMDLKVVGVAGEQLSYAASALRNWPFWLPGAMAGVTGQLIPTLFLLSIVAIAIVPFTARKQGLHDIMARALVIHRAQEIRE